MKLIKLDIQMFGISGGDEDITIEDQNHKYLNGTGLIHLVKKLKALIPSHFSQLIQDVPAETSNSFYMMNDQTEESQWHFYNWIRHKSSI